MPFFVLPYHIGVRKGMEGHLQKDMISCFYFDTGGHALQNNTKHGSVWKGMACQIMRGFERAWKGQVVVNKRAFK